jgi:hypothetical protein
MHEALAEANQRALALCWNLTHGDWNDYLSLLAIDPDPPATMLATFGLLNGALRVIATLQGSSIEDAYQFLIMHFAGQAGGGR